MLSYAAVRVARRFPDCLLMLLLHRLAVVLAQEAKEHALPTVSITDRLSSLPE